MYATTVIKYHIEKDRSSFFEPCILFNVKRYKNIKYYRYFQLICNIEDPSLNIHLISIIMKKLSYAEILSF
jgi:hypothetical protein